MDPPLPQIQVLPLRCELFSLGKLGWWEDERGILLQPCGKDERGVLIASVSGEDERGVLLQVCGEDERGVLLQVSF
jgi:hypothetical protein